MPGLTIRDARTSDIASLCELEARSFATDRLSGRSLRRLATSGSARLRVAVDRAIAGYHLVLFRRGSAVARLYSIAVAGPRRGAGVATALIADAERIAARRGCAVLRLEVRSDNRPAIRLYERAGYHKIGIRSQYYADKTDAVRYQKPLAAVRGVKA